MNAESLAEGQYGVITRAQARAAGMSDTAVDRRLRSGRWIPMHPGVYRIVGAPQTDRQGMMAATLWANGVVSHLGAAQLLHLEPLPAPVWIDVTVGRKTRLAAPDIVTHQSSLIRVDRVLVDGIPCTSATRTLLDCAMFCDGERLESAFEHARRLGLTSISELERRLSRSRRGSAAWRDVLAHVQARPRESRLEVKLARLLRTSELPNDAAQFPVGDYRIDHAWPGVRVGCESDGFAWHGNRLQWKCDRRRIATIEAAGWRLVHVTWEDATRQPTQTIERIRLALAQAA